MIVYDSAIGAIIIIEALHSFYTIFVLTLALGGGGWGGSAPLVFEQNCVLAINQRDAVRWIRGAGTYYVIWWGMEWGMARVASAWCVFLKFIGTEHTVTDVDS